MCLVNFCSDVSERQVPTLPVFKENVCCLLRVVKLVLIMPFLQVIIFVKTVYRCVALAGLLVEQNFPAICIHRDMKQEERLVRLTVVKKLSLISSHFTKKIGCWIPSSWYLFYKNLLTNFLFMPWLFSFVVRLSRYKEFKDFSKRMLVATNLFGRGMDIERVNIVFNYDMPEDSDTYLHRVNKSNRNYFPKNIRLE